MSANKTTTSDLAEIMNILIYEVGHDRDLFDTIVAILEGRARVVPATSERRPNSDLRSRSVVSSQR